MGKILSGPKAPPIQQVVQAPVTPAVATSSTPTDTSDAPEIKTDAQIGTEIRQESLLRHSRGRLGTINTSFRGFFDGVGESLNSTRKTLLGE